MSVNSNRQTFKAFLFKKGSQGLPTKINHTSAVILTLSSIIVISKKYHESPGRLFTFLISSVFKQDITVYLY